MLNFTYLVSWSCKKKNSWVDGVGWVGVVGLAGNEAKSVPIELKLGLSSATTTSSCNTRRGRKQKLPHKKTMY